MTVVVSKGLLFVSQRWYFLVGVCVGKEVYVGSVWSLVKAKGVGSNKRLSVLDFLLVSALLFNFPSFLYVISIDNINNHNFISICFSGVVGVYK